jgi:prevent-host-death family protein
MAQVTIRELRNHGGDVVDRVAAGERVIVTRSGKPVAELRPLQAKAVSNVELLRRWRRLRPADAVQWRRDLDAVIDPSL